MYALLFCAASSKKRFSTYLAKVTSSCEEQAESHTEFISKEGQSLYGVAIGWPHVSFHASLLYRVSSCSWVVQDLVENAEHRQLEEQGIHFQVDGQAVQHSSDAVVGVRRVFGVGL